MDEAFVIMQIGNPELDALWRDVYCPVIKDCGLEPKRVDKHNEGRLLQSEIANFITNARIIIADLTNERQNCYLEVGYAMGISKFKNLILCAKENHHHESSNYRKGGPKIHFDLSGYGFLWWDEKKLEEFKAELSSRIKQRLAILENDKAISSPVADIWIEEERKIAMPEFKKVNLKGGYYEISMESTVALSGKTVTDLLRIAGAAAVRTSGWPIGVVLHNELRPMPQADGIRCLISSVDRFDYWALKKDGRFYFLRGLDEDSSWKENKPGENVHLDTRIRRITEAVMYCSNLYKGLGASEDAQIEIRILHKGLLNRIIAAIDPGRFIPDHWKCGVNEVESREMRRLSTLMPDIKEIVFKIATELFVMFDYFDIKKSVSDDIVDKFLAGRT